VHKKIHPRKPSWAQYSDKIKIFWKKNLPA